MYSLVMGQASEVMTGLGTEGVPVGSMQISEVLNDITVVGRERHAVPRG